MIGTVIVDNSDIKQIYTPKKKAFESDPKGIRSYPGKVSVTYPIREKYGCASHGTVVLQYAEKKRTDLPNDQNWPPYITNFSPTLARIIHEEVQVEPVEFKDRRNKMAGVTNDTGLFHY